MSAERDERLSALLDGALTPAEAAALRAEVAGSPALAERLAALAAVDEGLRALPGRPVPSDLRARVERALGASAPRRAPPSRRRWLGASALAGAAAAAVLALFLVRGAEQAPTPLAQRTPEPSVEPPPAPLAERAPAPSAAPPLEPAPPPVAIAERPVPAPVERMDRPVPPSPPEPTPPLAVAEPAPEPAHEASPPPVAPEPALEDVALGDDLPIIEVLDLLAELDELEGNGHG
jgi:hypothetical protein